MKKLMTVFVTFLGLVTTGAQAAEKSDVWEMLQRIDSELRHYDQSPRDLDRAMARLEEALTILRGEPGNSPEECQDFAINEFVKDGYSNSLAMDKARSFCRSAKANDMSMELVRFFSQRLKEDGYNSVLAFDNTLTLGKGMSDRDLSHC